MSKSVFFLLAALVLSLLLTAAGAEAGTTFAFAPEIVASNGSAFPVDGSATYEEIAAAFGAPAEVRNGAISGEVEPGEPDGNVYDTRIMYLDRYGWSQGCLYFANGMLLRADGAVWVGGGYEITELFAVSGIPAGIPGDAFWSTLANVRYENRNMATELYYRNENGVPVLVEATGQGRTFTGGDTPWTETVYADEDLTPWRKDGLWRVYYKDGGWLLLYLPPQA